jgi:phospholipid/cholesterol/gamma-HCH transport system ATP-binding protein
MFLHEGTARFFGTVKEMRLSDDPVLREFFSLDELILPM